MFRCILCLKPRKDNEPITLANKVNERVTLEDCIRINIPCADTIINDYDNAQYSCTECFMEFVNFYEFLGKVEENYGWSFDAIQVKTEKAGDDIISPLDNFIDITQIGQGYNIEPVLQKCSVRLERIKDFETSLKEEKIKEEKFDSNDETIEPITKIEEHGDSDFEWPQNEDETTTWSLPATSTAQIDSDTPVVKPPKPKPKWKTSSKSRISDDDDDDDYDPQATKKLKQGYIRYLPRNRCTPEILASKGDYITIDGLEYKIPRRNRATPIKEKHPKLESLNRNRRPHRAYDNEGEQKILNSVEVKCYECDEKFESFFRVRKHFKAHHPGIKGYLKCCNRKFTRRYELLEHLEYHDKSVVHRCKVCNNGKDYKTIGSLRMHIKVCHLKIYENVQYMCEDCGRIFKYSHSDKPRIKIPFICETCGKSFGTQASLNNHLISHDTKTYECYKCKKVKISPAAVKHHLLIHHTPKVMVQCTVCSKPVRDVNLRHHMKYAHKKSDGDKRIQCNICGHWLLPCSWQSHKVYHQQEGSECHICGRKFKHKYSVNKHIKIVHEQAEKKHVCEHCGKKFSQPLKLKEHVAVVHTREFPWACRICNRPYRAEGNWRIHEKKAHPEEYRERFMPKYMKPQIENEVSEPQATEQIEEIDYNILELQ